jgi:hypothetical protein
MEPPAELSRSLAGGASGIVSAPTLWKMRRLLRLGVVLAVLGLAGALAGCGGGASTTTSGEPISVEQLSQAAAASADATSGRFSFSLDMTVPGTTEPFAFSGEGAFDARANRAAISIDLSSVARVIGDMFPGLGASTDAPDFGDPDVWQIDALQDGDVVYMRFPVLSSELPAGKSWVRLDVAQALEKQGFNLPELQELTGNDPRKMLDFLRAASDEIETIGTEELRGVRTTHYRATVNLADYDKLVPADKREELRSMFGEMIEQTGLGEIPVDVWLDDFGLVRRLDMSMTATQPGTAEFLDATMTFELFDYGKEVDVQPPPAAEVVDASALG